MTERDSLDDDAWLNALQSKDKAVHPEAERVKRAMELRAQRLSQNVPIADEFLYSELRFRIRRENLLRDSQNGYRLAAVAASIVAAVALTFALLPDHSSLNDYSSVRSTGDGPNVLVTDPELEAQALVVRLRAAGVDSQVKRMEGRVIVVVPASLDAIEVLDQNKLPSYKAGDHLEVIFMKKR